MIQGKVVSSFGCPPSSIPTHAQAGPPQCAGESGDWTDPCGYAEGTLQGVPAEGAGGDHTPLVKPTPEGLHLPRVVPLSNSHTGTLYTSYVLRERERGCVCVYVYVICLCEHVYLLCICL